MNHRQSDYMQHKTGELEDAEREVKRLRTLVETEDLAESQRTVKYDDLIQALEFQIIEIRRQLDRLRGSGPGQWEDLRSNLDLATETLRNNLGNLEARISDPKISDQ